MATLSSFASMVPDPSVSNKSNASLQGPIGKSFTFAQGQQLYREEGDKSKHCSLGIQAELALKIRQAQSTYLISDFCSSVNPGGLFCFLSRRATATAFL